MKRTIKVLLSLMLAVSLFGCTTKKDTTKFTPGTYTGEGQGYGGAVTATVTLSEDAITEIVVEANDETATIGGSAIEVLISEVIEKQSTQIDVISGATRSSNGFIDAVNAALEAAGVDPSKLLQLKEKLF